MATEATTKVKSLRLREHEVRALLRDGRALMVRPVKPQPPDWIREFGFCVFTPAGYMSGRGSHPVHGPCDVHFRCPFGRVGERRWCQEPFYDRGDYSTLGKYMTNRYVYKADETHSGWILHQAGHMPRSVSRLTVEVAAVRCKRAQDVTDDEAKATGLKGVQYDKNKGGFLDEHREHLCRVFNKIHGLDAWASNPWVWLGDVRRVEG